MMKYNLLPLIVLSLFLSGCFTEKSEIRVAGLFTDNMVLQQNSNVPIWGWATAGSSVKVETSWGEKVTASATDDGKWEVAIKTPITKSKEQHLIIKTSDSTITLSNVLLGEVWLASGQSNMEMPVSGWLPSDPLLNSQEEIASANFPAIRMFTVRKETSFKPLDDVTGSWQITKKETVPDFSAAAYFFGRALFHELGVPIGIIHSSWGGSPAESWVPLGAIKNIEGFELIPEIITKASNPNIPFNLWLNSMKLTLWDELISTRAFHLADQRFSEVMQPSYDDADWDTLSVGTMSKLFMNDDFNGLAWYRQEFFLDKAALDDVRKLFLGDVQDLNTTFINGQMVGRVESWGKNTIDHVYDIPSGLLLEGRNVMAVRVIDVWENGGIFDVPKLLDTNEQLVLQLKETWKYLPAAILIDGNFYTLNDGLTGIQQPEDDRVPLTSHTPTALYNGMIAPLIPYTIKGAIWYQGESNVPRYEQYRTLFPSVFNSWRSKWAIGDFPFYYVQLAPFNYNGSPVEELRQVQLETLVESNVGMVVTMDIGSATTIHPPNKQDVGKRLALHALAKTYGKSELVYSGPIYKDVIFDNQQAVVAFDHIGGGLYCPDEALAYFEIAGADGVFHPAKATIDKGSVIVNSTIVQNPLMVRYAWGDKIKTNLFNKEGLPASPFRTKKL
ncbi:MAG: sialate O-acetylesterase [Cyclobacteriaceae bacterium]|jgi:sialate O-acetylesterase